MRKCLEKCVEGTGEIKGPLFMLWQCNRAKKRNTKIRFCEWEVIDRDKSDFNRVIRSKVQLGKEENGTKGE